MDAVQLELHACRCDEGKALRLRREAREELAGRVRHLGEGEMRSEGEGKGEG